MSWNPPPNGQAGMVQRPPVAPGAPNSNNFSMTPNPMIRGPPVGGQMQMPPSMGPPPPSLNPSHSRGDQRLPPPMHNGPPANISLANNKLPPQPGKPDSPQMNRPPPPGGSMNGKTLVLLHLAVTFGLISCFRCFFFNLLSSTQLLY